MTSDNSTRSVCDLWQNQPAGDFQISTELLRNKSKRLKRTLLVRDSTAWLVCLFEIAWFSYIFAVVPQLVAKIGSVMIMVGMAYMTGQIWLDQRNRRNSRARAEASGNINSLEFLRAELVRQREFHRGIWFWSRAVLLFAGMLVFGIGAMVVFSGTDKLVGFAVTAVTVILLPVAVWLNRKRSRQYQREIDQIDTLMLPAAQSNSK